MYWVLCLLYRSSILTESYFPGGLVDYWKLKLSSIPTEFQLWMELSLAIADLFNALFSLFCKVEEPPCSISPMSQVTLTDIQSQKSNYLVANITTKGPL